MDPDRWYDEIHDIDGFRRNRSPDEAIARIATWSGGVVGRAQLAALGLTRGAIEHRIRTGRLRPLHRGVYAVGHEAIQVRGRLVAGLLTAGPGAALSHRSAAALWRIIPSMPEFVDLTTTNRSRRSRGGLVFHQTLAVDATTLHDLPVTPPVRTLRDLAATRPGPRSSARAARRSSSASSPPSSLRSSRVPERHCSPASRATALHQRARTWSAVCSKQFYEPACPGRRSTRK